MPLADRLNAAGLTAQPPGTAVRVIIEKPFGRDLVTARELNERLHTAFIEEQIYRIDHYLGKETVQNLLVFRFANGIFEPLWNRQYIDHVQITVAEEIGVEGRASYYEGAGALRDIVQNHIMQLVAIVGMEAPSNFQAEMVRDEKVKLLRAVRPIHPDDALSHSVRGQYSAGVVAGVPVPGYREERDVAPDSLRETFVALKVDIDNWRWAVLSANRQADAEARDGDRDPVPTRSPFTVCGERPPGIETGSDRWDRAEPACPAHPT
jgi:glucose-6-phosphate 1-dehydrogenase